MKFRNSLRRRAVAMISVMMIILGLMLGLATSVAVDSGQSDKIALQLNEAAIRESRDINKHMIEAETAVKSIYALANQLVTSSEEMKDPLARQTVKKSVNDVFEGIAKDSDSVKAYYMTFDPELIHDRDGVFYSKDNKGKLHENEITDIASYAPNDVEHIGWYTIPKEEGKPVWLEPYYNKNIDSWLISYVIPFYKDDSLIAVIGIDFGFKDIVDDINQIRFLDNGYCFLKSSDGSVHYHEEFFNGEVHGDETCEIPEESRELFESGETQDQTVIYTYEDTKWVGVLTRLENGMVLFVVDTYAEVYHDRNLLLFLVVVFTLLITATAVIITQFAAKKITVPLEQITDAMSQMENGDFDVNLPKTRSDEIGILVQGTQLLASTLKKQKSFNLTSIAERNRQLESAIVDAENANRAKTAFISNMSHDIRTPMNAILGLSELAKKHIDEKERVIFYVDQIGVAGNQLLSLINNVLEISRIESNRIDIEEENTDTQEVYQTLLTIFENQAEAKNLTVRFHNELKQRWLYLDRTRMSEIIMNLVSNAMKYTQPGGQVDVTFESLPGLDSAHINCRITVKDNGIGMSEEYQKKLFQSFEREEDSRVNKIQGTGLGLSIVKRLVDMMGGTISINSVKGLGTSVIVELPQRIGSAPNTVVDCSEKSDVTDHHGKRILLAEDNDINALIVDDLMKDGGILIDRVRDGQECVNRINSVEADYYEMILMDIQMPVMDGLEATRRIRHMEDSKKARMPIVAISANAFKEDRIAAMNAGMNGHIAKPLEVSKVIATLDRILSYKNYYVDTKELNEFREKYTRLGCMCGYFIYRDDNAESIVYSDPVTELIYGCDTEDEFMRFVGGSFKNMVHPEDVDLVEQKIKDQQNQGNNHIDIVSYRIIRKDGEIRKIRDIGYKTFSGKEMLFYVFIADVTDLNE